MRQTRINLFILRVQALSFSFNSPILSCCSNLPEVLQKTRYTVELLYAARYLLQCAVISSFVSSQFFSKQCTPLFLPAKLHWDTDHFNILHQGNIRIHSSISTGLIFSPPRMIISLILPLIVYPATVIVYMNPRSPV